MNSRKLTLAGNGDPDDRENVKAGTSARRLRHHPDRAAEAQAEVATLRRWEGGVPRHVEGKADRVW